jgi:2',3'-cyclic-nucleotide 2'-phosphodiesterase (5'-nucleotidase family)
MRFTVGLVALAGLSYASPLDQWPIRVPSQPQKLPPPSRPLQWGDINVIATTDTHGWSVPHDFIDSK